MTTNFVAIANNLTIKQAMRSLIRQAADNDNISTLYALNEDGTFYGAIALKDRSVPRSCFPTMPPENTLIGRPSGMR